MYQYSYLVEQVEVLLRLNSRDSPTETLTAHGNTQFPARRDRRPGAAAAALAAALANDVTYTQFPHVYRWSDE